MTRLLLVVACLACAVPASAQLTPVGPSVNLPAAGCYQINNDSFICRSVAGVFTIGLAKNPADNVWVFDASTTTFKLGILSGGTATNPLTVTNAGLITTLGGVAAGGNINTTATGNIYWLGRAAFGSSADGLLAITTNNTSIGSTIKVDALPTVASGFGGSPAITAGSTPFAGSVNVGTGGVATSGVINFNGTAFPSAPFCVANDATTTLAQRASASTTQLTITSAAWTASDVVTWVCISSK